MIINVYKFTVDFNVPKYGAPHDALKLKAGHRLITVDNDVYVKSVKSQDEFSDDTYIQALLTTKFVKINPKIFKKI